ncbi:hypothetical protein B0T24DRAFT_598151 [Lasiosphaeria ovina]|uniref:Uncharacterized protein n=1 Tax=Lasiosphaeria ovina TaxID=92902 RepID=A0AAE0JW48_9PEZI|nr:hypothetical protein B0T24DRAFT_598151 [Lasiosphaeria ovina]
MAWLLSRHLSPLFSTASLPVVVFSSLVPTPLACHDKSSSPNTTFTGDDSLSEEPWTFDDLPDFPEDEFSATSHARLTHRIESTSVLQRSNGKRPLIGNKFTTRRRENKNSAPAPSGQRNPHDERSLEHGTTSTDTITCWSSMLEPFTRPANTNVHLERSSYPTEVIIGEEVIKWAALLWSPVVQRENIVFGAGNTTQRGHRGSRSMDGLQDKGQSTTQAQAQQP